MDQKIASNNRRLKKSGAIENRDSTVIFKIVEKAVSSGNNNKNIKQKKNVSVSTTL